MNDASLLQVGMGELRVGGPGEFLRATLGSCVGIGFIWRKGGRCGLAHCLLPSAPERPLRPGARYVDQALPSLLMLMGIRQADYPDVEVVIAGGARMFSLSQNSANVGRQNTDRAAYLLGERGLVIARSEVGGRRGRQMIIDCTQQRFVVSQIARQPEEYAHGCP